MSNNSDTPNTDIANSDNGNDGFVWSRRLTVIAGILLALALAATRFASALAGPLEWVQ